MSTKRMRTWTCSRCGVAIPLHDKLDHLQHCVSKHGEHAMPDREQPMTRDEVVKGLEGMLRMTATTCVEENILCAAIALLTPARVVIDPDEQDPIEEANARASMFQRLAEEAEAECARLRERERRVREWLEVTTLADSFEDVIAGKEPA